MNANIILNGLSREDFQNDILKAISQALGRNINPDSFGGCIDGVEFSFDGQSKKKQTTVPIPKEKYLTRGEVSQFLKISLPTLHRYTKDGILKSYRIVGKVRYKIEDVENALKERNFGLPKKGGLNA